MMQGERLRAILNTSWILFSLSPTNCNQFDGIRNYLGKDIDAGKMDELEACQLCFQLLQHGSLACAGWPGYNQTFDGTEARLLEHRLVLQTESG